MSSVDFCSNLIYT